MSHLLRPAYVFRAQTYTGYVPQEGELMRFLGFKDGFLELSLVESATAVQDGIVPKLENMNIEHEEPVLSAAEVKADANSTELAGTSPARAIDLMDTDDEDALANPDHQEDDDDDTPLAQVMATTAGAPVLPAHAVRTVRPLIRRAGKPTKDEKLDMAMYIVGEKLTSDMTYPSSWAKFRKSKDHKRRAAVTWVKIYRNNREEIEEKVCEMRAIIQRRAPAPKETEKTPILTRMV
ncbi:unnamed protein product [Peniophora sp. CBMAI 1063]|nr:unnamed protein product [Peniophora sp. CBMAI 1063]